MHELKKRVNTLIRRNYPKSLR